MTSQPHWITLLTDFGPKDSYIGVMKGVIATIAPRAMVVDLSHGVSPQDVVQGAFLLAASYSFFPPGTIHVAVVDPGVGGERAVLAAEFEGFRFLAPDNGLLGGVLKARTPDAMVRVEDPRFFLSPVSGTFHGRDIFAPVAGHLANGIAIEELGPAHEGDLAPPWPAPVPEPGGGLAGEVIYCDHFGNCITNIPVTEPPTGFARLADGRTLPRGHHYAEVAEGESLALRGSSGYLEIAVRNGRADEVLGLARGSSVWWSDRGPGDDTAGRDPEVV